MVKTTAFPGIETVYTDLADIPTSNEMNVVADGADYNITIQQVLDAAVAIGLSDATAAALAGQLDDYITGGGGGGPGVIDDDTLSADSATQAASQSSTKAYADTKAASSHTHVATAISDSTAAGRAVLTAATAAAQRTALGLTEAEIVADVNSVGGVALASVDDLDTGTAGGLALDGIAANLSPTALQFIRRNAGNTDFEPITLGSSAYVAAIPTGAPTAATQSSGSITLNYASVDVLETTTTAAITTITFSNIAAYSTVLWRVKHTTARNITFPAGTNVAGNGGALLVTSTANSTHNFLIYNDNGTYEVFVTDPHVVGA